MQGIAGAVAVELCSGMGGIGLGASRVGFVVERAYDSWCQAVSIYNYNSQRSGDVAVECDLVQSAGLRRVTSDKRKLGEIELLLAGPPCKGFSQLKNGFHDGRISHNRINNRVLRAIPHYIGILQPRYVMLENVPALFAHRSGKTFTDFLKMMMRPAKRLAYRIEWQVYDAAQFGTPQTRRRLIVFAVRTDADQDEHLPQAGPDLRRLYTAIRHRGKIPSGMAVYLAELADKNNARLVTASQALSDLPTLGAGESELPRKYRTAPQCAYQKWARGGVRGLLSGTQTPGVNDSTMRRLAHIPPGGSVRDIPVEALDGLSRRFSSAYRRLHPEAPSTALSTKYDCVYHYDQYRSLSLREYCRLQGIPDSFAFPAGLVSRRSAYEMIGNSVPPRLIEEVLRQTLKPAKSEFHELQRRVVGA